MLQQKQGARVRIISQEKVINMSEDYFTSGSKCSCLQCDSISCFKIRHINSGISCTCTDCNLQRCLTWEIENDEFKSNDKMENIKESPNVSKTKFRCSNSDIKNCTKCPIKPTKEMRKEDILSYQENDLNNNSNDLELKEVFIKEKNLTDKITNPTENNIDNLEIKIKMTSSNENSDFIECDIKPLKEKHFNEPETKQLFAKDDTDTNNSLLKNEALEAENCYDHVTNQSLASNDIKEEHLSLNEPSQRNEFADPTTKEIFARKVRKCCSLSIADNKKSDVPEVYQIFTNEKKNIVKCCNISKEVKKKYTDDLENQQGNVETERKCCTESKIIQDKNNSTTEPNSEINTIKKIKNVKCIHKHPINDKTSDIDFGNYTEYTYKDVSHTKNKINVDRYKKSYEKYVSRLQSVAVSYARQDCENSRAELSAQIMNVPYEEFKDSLSRKQSSTEFNICNSSNKIEKNDIFTRLKEIYKACSCKVCECIAGKSIFSPNETCKCKPCDCNDCNGYMAKLQRRIDNIPHSGCPCVKCDRKDCRGVVKSIHDYISCDCKPCDCVRCTESFTKTCSCTPCQCETCKTSLFIPQTITVANAEKSFRQNNCDCEPCECTNCTSNYSAMTSNLMREVSTGMISGNCNCENCFNTTCQLGGSNCICDSQHKVIRKPMAMKKPDYDIHRVYIKENNYENNKNVNNAITMFALSNNYPNTFIDYSNKRKVCECEVCECIVCKDRGKETVPNKYLNIEINKHNNNKFNSNLLNNCKFSPHACQLCKSLESKNFKGNFFAKTRYGGCNCTNSKYLEYTSKIINNKENNTLKRITPSYFLFENNYSCKLHELPECKNVVNLQSQDSKDTDEAYLHNNEQIYLLKKGKLLTPSMFEKNRIKSDSYNIKPEKESFIEDDLRKEYFSKVQQNVLCRSKSRTNNFANDDTGDITYKTLKSALKVIARNSSLMNMVSNEEDTNEIYKNNSIDFKNGNNSRIFCEHSKNYIQNYDSNTVMFDKVLTHVSAIPSLDYFTKKVEYNNGQNEICQNPLLGGQVRDIFSKTMSSSNTDVHFSSAKSMSLVKMLCQERNLNIDQKRSQKFLQSLEKITLKRLKMDDENCPHTYDNDIFFDSFGKENFSYSNYNTTDNLLFDIDQDKLDTLNCDNKKVETNLIVKKMDSYNVHDKNTVNPPETRTTKQIKSKDVTNLQKDERKPNNYNKNIKPNGSAVQTKINKSRSKENIVNNNFRSKTGNNIKPKVNQVNNKRCLEIPNLIDTATSAINFNESDKRIDFERSFKLLKEVNFKINENKKSSPILRKNFFFNSGIVTKTGNYPISLIGLDVKNAVKSTSLQTNLTFPYYPGIGFANKALTKLQNEVNELFLSPLLQPSRTSSQAEKFRSKSKLNLELKSSMRDATSQTKRKKIFVDKEVNCNFSQSRDNLEKSIQNLINTTLLNVYDVKRENIERKKQNLTRELNKVSRLNAAKISCDGLRTRFVGLKKVSDHTVLLKWAMPRDPSHIQGYELQVDGRPVQKILNPSRCMAVLTCLPHCEKLLLTIRTITNLETCHNPVTTVVYNPRKKN